MNDSLDSKLQVYSMCAIRTRSRKQLILKNIVQNNSNSYVACFR